MLEAKSIEEVQCTEIFANAVARASCYPSGEGASFISALLFPSLSLISLGEQSVECPLGWGFGVSILITIDKEEKVRKPKIQEK